MPTHLYRIASALHPPFDGTGASKTGARWNSPGRSVIYCGPNLSCCRLELIANLRDAVIKRAYVWVVVELPRDLSVERLLPNTLLTGWDSLRPSGITRTIGDAWYDSRRSLLMEVPSVASPGEFNILVNQDHPDFARLVVSDPVPVTWDPRTVR